MQISVADSNPVFESGACRSGSDGWRMPEKTASKFLKVKSSEEVLAMLDQLEPLPGEETDLAEACGKVLVRSMVAPEPVPHFARATMDGYAVRARDTFGASETLPALLETAGETSMGETAGGRLEPGKAIAVPTGGMLPEGADAVVMVEYTYRMDDSTIEVTRPVAPGDNLLREGEDVPVGRELFPGGWRLRPQDVGVLAALGITRVEVRRRPRVAIISTGDEIVSADSSQPPPGKIRDINSFTLAAQVWEAGADIGLRKVIPDDLLLLTDVCRQALADHDVIVLSGGSSVGARDYTLSIIEQLPESELLVHGVAVRPGKPTILARAAGKVFWGLPGQPVSAMMICRAFVLPSLERLQGRGRERARIDVNRLTAELVRQVPSVHGRTDYIPVMVSSSHGRLRAEPVFGKSAMISTLARADGYIVIPEHVEGLDQGAEVTVVLFSGQGRNG